MWITNFQPTLNPFDQYKEMLSVDTDGSLVMKWGWDAESPSSYQYTLRDGYEYEIYDPVVTAAVSNGGYVVTKSNVNSSSQEPTYIWPVLLMSGRLRIFIVSRRVLTGMRQRLSIR